MLPDPFVRQVDLRTKYNLLSFADLWLRCYALGTMNTHRQLVAILRGTRRPTRHEYNLIALALNEYLTDIGMPQIVPYIEDDTAHCLNASWSGLAASPSQRRSAPNSSAYRRRGRAVDIHGVKFRKVCPDPGLAQ
jgi:hypothetical protein